jgi:cell fate (sporulation/competence/biofilm development) regulator YmcA (YheA/YmcA/DUF963 family)
MNKITLNNYEIFLLDYFEGNLEKTQKHELQRFLAQHPHIKNEIEDFEIVKLKPENVKFHKSVELLKSETSIEMGINYFDYLCIADIENDINKEEKKELTYHLNRYKNLNRIYFSYKKSKLQVIENITFPLKKHIKKYSIGINFKTIGSVAAAIIVLFFGVSQTKLFKNNTTSTGQKTVLSEIKHETKQGYYHQQINKQEALISHNQTDKQIHNNVLAFNDTEPLVDENSYKETKLNVPVIKTEARIFDKLNPDISINQLTSKTIVSDNKNIFWQSAEKGMDIFKLLTSNDDLTMDNRYKSDGSIDKFVISTTNIKFSKTFNKSKNQLVYNQ